MAEKAVAVLKLSCPGCETFLKLPAGVPAGKLIRCPKCKATFRGPDPDPTVESLGQLEKAVEAPACPMCGFADFMHVQVGANTIVERDGSVLLVRLNYGPRDGHWALPGGLVESDETTTEAAIRETIEETGFTVELDGLLATWMRPGFPILVVIYRAHITAGDLRVATDEASEARFFPRDRVPPLEELAWPS